MGKKTVLNHLSCSLPYWEQSQIDVLDLLFSDVKTGDLVLDPFCGSGIPALVALQQGARVVAGDLNPMAVLLTRVLLQPMGLFALREEFQSVREAVADRIGDRYTILCPGCGKKTGFEQLIWKSAEGREDEIRPDAVRSVCINCGFKGTERLTDSQVRRQITQSRTSPENWFPRKKIQGTGSKNSFYIHDQFTQRNLASLADLFHGINSISMKKSLEFFQSVFISILFQCITKGISGNSFNALSDASIPGIRKSSVSLEVNVWKAFEDQFEKWMQNKKTTNAILSFVRFSDSIKAFEDTDDHSTIIHSDCLEFPFPQKRKITHVFLDPPGDQAGVCLSASEFQGAWLRKGVHRNRFWNTELQSIEDNLEQFQKLLEKIAASTDDSCRIILSHRASKKETWEALQDKSSAAGYELQDLESVGSLIPRRKKKQGKTEAEKYGFLVRTRRKNRRPGLELSDKKTKAVSLHETQFPRPIQSAIVRLLSEASENHKAYNRLCLILLETILAKDGYRIVFAEPNQFDWSEADREIPPEALRSHNKNFPAIDIVAEHPDGKQIFFCFYNPGNEKKHKQVAGKIFQQDRQTFHRVCYLIFENRLQMNSCRQIEWADNWPRGFFVCYPDLCQQAGKIQPDLFRDLSNRFSKRAAPSRKKGIRHFKAEVLRNSPVGLDGKPMHYKLEFQTSDMKNIGPGQFVMVDPLPCGQRKKMDQIRYQDFSTIGNKKNWEKIRIDLIPKSYLKRPFGVQRAYYNCFEWGYHQTLSLPPILAGITHTVFPHKFEIFYKKIEGGIGTREMTNLKKGDQVHMLGPLGKYTHIPEWRSQGISEVHLVGGGVGMAPLVFFGQALKFYSFDLKAFIGIDRIESLRETPYGKSFAEEPEKAYVYIEELVGIGLRPGDIYLSREYRDNEQLSEKIPEDNYHYGLVTDQYRSYLEKIKNRKNLMIIACGPKPMMVVLQRIASGFDIPMKVLLEKRMGCGIGVCMSCVCRTKKDQKSQYSRVCVEGPVFDANEIDWEKL